MKKIIIPILGLFIFIMAETSVAQIVGKDQNPRRDTVKRRDTVHRHLPAGRTDTVKREETVRERELRKQREEYNRERQRLEKERRKLERERDSLDRKYEAVRTESNFGRKVDSTAKVIGRKGAEVGAKAVASIKDRSLENVKGPKGEKVYVDKYDRRYFINKEGKKIYLRKPKTETPPKSK